MLDCHRYRETRDRTATKSRFSRQAFSASLSDEGREMEMSNEDRYPHFDFNFQKIREHWKATLGNYQAASEYLHVVERRLRYWLQERGSWVEFDFAAKHLEEDLGLKDVESRLIWLALRHRVQLDNEQMARLGPRHRQHDSDSYPD